MRSSEVVNELSNGHTEGNVRVELTVSASSECVRAGNIKHALQTKTYLVLALFRSRKALARSKAELAASLARTTLRFSPVFSGTNTITFAAGLYSG